MTEVATLLLVIFVVGVLILPASAYLCFKYATIGYWAGFVHSAKNGAMPIGILEEDDQQEG